MARPARKPYRYRTVERSIRQRAWLIGLAAFLLVDAALVAAAYLSTHSHSSDQKPGPIPTYGIYTPTPGSTPIPSSTAAPSATSAAEVAATSQTYFLSAVDGKTAWRSTTGSCPGTAAKPELTTDGGATWKASDATGPAKVSSVIRVQSVSSRVAYLIALSKSGCKPVLVQTYVSGDNWAAYPTRTGSAWYLNPADPKTIHSPNGSHATPCTTAVDLISSGNSNAAVLCSDHTLFRTTNGGSSWGKGTVVPRAVTIATSSSGYSAAVTDQPSCAGVGIVSLPSAPASTETTFAGSLTGCFAASTPDPASVAISAAGKSLWLWLGSATHISADGGATW